MNATKQPNETAGTDPEVQQLFAHLRELRALNEVLADKANAAMPVLIAAMQHKTNQSYHLRALLYSLWNGQPTSLLNVVDLDRALRTAWLDVVAAFGSDFFFYEDLALPIKAAGLFDWFCQEGRK